MAKNLRCDTEFLREVRGLYGALYSARIPQADQQEVIDAEAGIANGSFVELGNLEPNEREIHVAVKPTGAKETYVVMRPEVNPSQYVISDADYGKFRSNIKNPVPVVKLLENDILGLSEDFFPSLPAVGDVFNLDANFIAGTQLVAGAKASGTFSLEVIEVRPAGVFHFVLGDGTIPTAYNMISVKVSYEA